MFIRCFLCLFSFVFIATNLFGQGLIDGFNKGKGNLDLVPSYTMESLSKFRGNNEDFDIPRTYQSFSLYAAYGLTDKIDINVNVPFIINKDQYFFQDGMLVLKSRLVDMPYGAGGKMQVYTAVGVFSPLSSYPAQHSYAIGQQATSVEARLMLQFMGARYFFNVQSGVSQRSKPTPSSVPLGIKAGMWGDRWYADVWMHMQNTSGGVDFPGNMSIEFAAMGVSWLKLGGTYYRGFASGKSGAFVGFGYIVDGRNIGLGPRISLGYVRKMSLLKKVGE